MKLSKVSVVVGDLDWWGFWFFFFFRYRGLPLKELSQHLQLALYDVKKYSHVNKKAMDQYVSFSEQRDDLEARREELDKSERAIADLIDALDAQKKEAIERTLKHVAKHFNATFATLSAGGVANLLREKKYAHR